MFALASFRSTLTVHNNWFIFKTDPRYTNRNIHSASHIQTRRVTYKHIRNSVRLIVCEPVKAYI